MNWIARSSQQLDQKLLFLPYRDHWAHLRTRVSTILTAHSACIRVTFLLLLAAWAAYSWFLTVERILRYYNPLPIWDYWNVVQHLPQYRAFDIRVLWVQHNEHRIVFPEIVFAVDMLLVHGREVLPLVISFFCYFSTWLVMSWTIFSDRGLSRMTRYSAILLAGIVIGWQGSVMALGIPFLLNWTMTQFAAVLALALVAALRNNSRIVYLAETVICGTVATYSSANGLLIWPVILLTGLVSSMRRGYILVVAIAGIANLSLYFVSYHVSHALDLNNLIRHPIYLLAFLSSYVSMPFGALKVGNFGVWVGLANFVLFFYLVAVSARTRLLTSAPAIVLLGYFLFTMLTALLTAAGRMNPSDMTFTAAKASRYLTIPLANWGALLIALIWLSARRGWKLVSPKTIVLASSVLLFVTFPKFGPWLYGNDLLFAQQQWATLSVENGLFDLAIARYLYPDPPFIRPFLQYLRDDHLSLFYRGYNLSLGQPFTSRFSPPSTQSRPGRVTQILPVSGGLELVGWTDGSRPERFVFVDQSARIVGLGRKLPAGFPPALSRDTPPSLAWVGFINLSFGSKSFSTYSFGHHQGRPTPIAGPSPITAFAPDPAHVRSPSPVQR
ncbi:MAG: hypothetical protein ACR2JB_08430 [Bryobacteraceae bacterium]